MQFLKTTLHNPLFFISGDLFVCKENFVHPHRNLDSFEIILGLKGASYIQQDNTHYEVERDHVLLLLPNHEHKGYAHSSEEISFQWLHFYCLNAYEIIDEDVARAEILSLKNVHPTNELTSYIYIPIFSAPAQIERIHIIFRQLLHVANAQYYTKQAVNYALTSLLIEISEQYISSTLQEIEANVSRAPLMKVVEYIRNNCTRNINVAGIAEEFFYNKDYLSRIFKKEMGTSIHDYIILQKLTKSKELLTQTGQSIKEIAYLLGFEDEKYFMKLFKKYEQVTPTDYRNAFY